MDFGTRMDSLSLEPDREPTSLIGKIGDIFLRGQYASASFFETMLSEGGLALGSAVSNSMREFINPKYRLSYTDLIQKHSPEFARNNPGMTKVMGFIGDIAFDPLTWTTFGTAAGRNVIIKGARKQLSKKASKAFVQDLHLKAQQPKLTAKGQEMLVQMYKKYRRSGMNAADSYALSMSTLKTGVNSVVKPGHHPRQIWQMTNMVDAEEQFGKLVDRTLNSVDLKTAFLAKHGMKEADIFASTGIRFMGKKLPGSQALAEGIGKAVGNLTAPLKETKFASYISKAFNKNAGVPPEIRDAIQRYHGEISGKEDELKHFLAGIVNNPHIKEDSLSAIGTWAMYFQEMGNKLYRQAKIAPGGAGIDKSTAAQEAWRRVSQMMGSDQLMIRMSGSKSAKRVRNLISKHDPSAAAYALRQLNPEERHTLVTMMQHMKDMGALEMEAGLISRMRGVYWPGYYSELKNAGKFNNFRRSLQGARRCSLEEVQEPLDGVQGWLRAGAGRWHRVRASRDGSPEGCCSRASGGADDSPVP
jgi:hypothetical protein